jgi:hypothetical protein
MKPIFLFPAGALTSILSHLMYESPFFHLHINFIYSSSEISPLCALHPAVTVGGGGWQAPVTPVSSVNSLQLGGNHGSKIFP